MTTKRHSKRYVLKLPAEVRYGDTVIKGTTVRVSEKGFFVRTQVTFPVGTLINVKLRLPDESLCELKGIVKYARSIKLLERQNGMGIELIQGDLKFLAYVQSAANQG